MAPTNKPRCTRFEIEGGPDLLRLIASYGVIGYPGIGERTSVCFDLREGLENPGAGVRRGESVMIGRSGWVPAQWFVNGLLHEDGSGHNHILLLRGTGTYNRDYIATSFYSSGRRKGNLIVWDSGVTPPRTFALHDSDPPK